MSKRLLSAIILASISLIAATQLRPALIQTRAFLDDFSKNEKTTLSSYVQTLNSKYDGILASTQSIPVLNRGGYINLNGFMANAMGQRFMNQTIKLNNGHLLRTDQIGKRDTSAAEKQIIKLYNAQKARGGELLMVMAPTETSPYEDLLPAGYKAMDFQHQNADRLLSAVQKAGVPVLDLREKMREQGLSAAEVMLKTDHHWKPEYGFWGYAEIVKHLGNHGAISQPANQYSQSISLENFDITTFNAVFLGSAGKRVGVFYGGVDNWQVVTPKFDTEITAAITTDKITAKSGGFYDVCFKWHWDETRTPNYYTDTVFEQMYGYWGAPQASYMNSGAPVNAKITVISDSFGLMCATFMPLTFTHVDHIQPRTFPGFEDYDFEKYYNETRPDIVILLIYPPGYGDLAHDFLPSVK